MILTTLALLFAGLHSLAIAAERPNFLLIFTDDHGYGDVSTYHESDVRTPHIDRIAAEGMLFTAMRANCTVCSPSRAALLTGRYADRVGVPGVIRTKPEDSWGYFDPSVPTIADELKQAGYHTAIVGKWHLGLETPNTPNERGFDFFHGFLGDMMDSYTTHLRHGNNYMRRNAEVIEPNGHATDLFSDWAADYLRERANNPQQPFFLYLAYNAPHFPIEPPAEWLEKVKQRVPQLDEKRAKNVAFVEHLDDRIGRVLATLKETGLEQNTVVVFTADNGGYGDVVETTATNLLSHTTKQRTNAAGHLLQSVDALNKITAVQYDANGNRLQTRDPNSVGTDTVFDALNRQLETADTQEQAQLRPPGVRLQSRRTGDRTDRRG